MKPLKHRTREYIMGGLSYASVFLTPQYFRKKLASKNPHKPFLWGIEAVSTTYPQIHFIWLNWRWNFYSKWLCIYYLVLSIDYAFHGKGYIVRSTLGKVGFLLPTRPNSENVFKCNYGIIWLAEVMGPPFS